MRPRHHCRGRAADARGAGRSAARFNEAPASLPGKSGGIFVDPVTGLAASMRPRHHCRGRVWPDAEQQRGRRCASMRPRHHCRGRAGAHHAGASVVVGFNEAPASLPGKRPAEQSTAPARLAASMRPRHHCRGRGACTSRHSRWLGWGFNEAPASLPGKRRARRGQRAG